MSSQSSNHGEPKKPYMSSLRKLFYHMGWTPEQDHVYLSCLDEQLDKLESMCDPNGTISNEQISHGTLVVVGHELNKKFGTNYSEAQIVERFLHLRERYMTFRFIVLIPGVDFDNARNILEMGPHLWDYVTMKYKLARVYYKNKMIEPEWPLMQCIFMKFPKDVVNLLGDDENSLYPDSAYFSPNIEFGDFTNGPVESSSICTYDICSKKGGPSERLYKAPPRRGVQVTDSPHKSIKSIADSCSINQFESPTKSSAYYEEDNE